MASDDRDGRRDHQRRTGNDPQGPNRPRGRGYTPSAATTYRVSFERIGRDHHVPILEVEAANGDALAQHIHAYAGRFLGSKDYSVAVNGDRGTVEGGRFGRFTVEEVEPNG